jgi:hypothetical protein
MTGGDIVSALQYQVKAEIIQNYLRERRILEEETREYEDLLAQYRLVEAEAQEYRDDLACLLVSPDHYRAFFRTLDFSRTPLTWLSRNNPDRGPACPMGLTPKGFTKKGRYTNLVFATYDRLAGKAAQSRVLAQRLMALAGEINEDIRRFHQNYDLLAMIGFLRSLDLTELGRRRILGSNFTPAELASIEEKMAFARLKPRDDGVRSWPEMPNRKVAEKRAAGLVRDVFLKERESILPALSGPNRVGAGLGGGA